MSFPSGLLKTCSCVSNLPAFSGNSSTPPWEEPSAKSLKVSVFCVCVFFHFRRSYSNLCRNRKLFLPPDCSQSRYFPNPDVLGKWENEDRPAHGRQRARKPHRFREHRHVEREDAENPAPAAVHPGLLHHQSGLLAGGKLSSWQKQQPAEWSGHRAVVRDEARWVPRETPGQVAALHHIVDHTSTGLSSEQNSPAPGFNRMT